MIQYHGWFFLDFRRVYGEVISVRGNWSGCGGRPCCKKKGRDTRYMSRTLRSNIWAAGSDCSNSECRRCWHLVRSGGGNCRLSKRQNDERILTKIDECQAIRLGLIKKWASFNAVSS